MEAFLRLAGQLCLIVCVQAVLEVLAADRWQNHLQKVISTACYLAALLLVLRFMQTYLLDILRSMTYSFSMFSVFSVFSVLDGLRLVGF